MTQRRLIAIGNFDGVHVGHEHLVEDVVKDAARQQLRPAILTFDPPPALVLGKGQGALLTSLRRKCALLEAISAELEVLVVRFDSALSKMAPEEFVQSLLVERFEAGSIIVGRNFRFGHQRRGDLDTLQALGVHYGFSAHSTELLTVDGEAVSSTRIRGLVRAGSLAAANSLLGRPHRVAGVVRSGDGRGRQIGFPTANLDEIEELIPGNGVYACRVQLDGSGASLDAVANVGVRPTVGGRDFRTEVHILDFSGDIYGRSLSVDWHQRLRDEQRFSGMESLGRQLQLDVSNARRILSGLKASPSRQASSTQD